ncbi:ParB N-terminal domain-containing protein [Streptomyces sp. NPDC006551]|uniref:ParB/RepB/Spo0J family partition protein n=1 Tax=Streptomyces sp. NPDC006551 TaxID=3157178 RepID=UPI00339E747C
MAGRRTSLASLAGAKVDEVPGKSDPLLLSLPTHRLVATRFNPRRNFGTDDELRAFGEILTRQQLQPAVAVSKAAYLKLWPDEADEVGEATYVIANGERRLRASILVGRPTLEVILKEDVADSRATFLDAVLSENNDREDLDPIERALGIETMVAELGGAEQVAQHYKKTAGWVSQQRSLLKLTPELQRLVSLGEMPVRFARGIASKPAAEQAAAWREEQEARTAAKQRPPQRKRTPAPAAPTSASETGAPNVGDGGVSTPAADQVFTAVNHKPAPAGGGEAGPSPRGPVLTQGPDGDTNEAKPKAPGNTLVPKKPVTVPDPRGGHGQGGDAAAPAGTALAVSNGPGPDSQNGQGAAVGTDIAVRTTTEMVALPWVNGAAVMDVVFTKLSPPQRGAFIQRYFQLSQGVEQVAADMKADLSPEHRAALAGILQQVSALLTENE